jgi:hypothetical protein
VRYLGARPDKSREGVAATLRLRCNMGVMAGRRSTGRVCPVCEDELGYADVTKVYCSTACRQAAYRRRKVLRTSESEAASVASDGIADVRRLRLTIQRLLRTEALGAPASVRKSLHLAVKQCKAAEGWIPAARAVARRRAAPVEEEDSGPAGNVTVLASRRKT